MHEEVCFFALFRSLSSPNVPMSPFVVPSQCHLSELRLKLQGSFRKRNLLETFLEKLLGSLHIQNSCSKPNVMLDIVKLHQRRLTCLGFLHFTRFSKISRIHCRCFKILKTTKSSKLNVISLCTKKFLCLFLRTADGKENILRFVYYNIKFCQGSDGEGNINLR